MNGARITPADIQAEVVGERYFTAADGVMGELASDGVPPTAYERQNCPAGFSAITFCVIELRNGTKIVGVNYGAIDPSRHDAEMGRREARAHAVDQIWPLLGFRLRDRIAAER